MSKLRLSDVLAVIRELRAILPAQHEYEGLPPITVQVVAGGPAVPPTTSIIALPSSKCKAGLAKTTNSLLALHCRLHAILPWPEAAFSGHPFVVDALS